MQNSIREHHTPKENIDLILRDKTGKLVVYVYNNGYKPAVKVFIGKQLRPQIYHTFKDNAQRDSWTENYFRSTARNIAAHEERKLKERLDRTQGAKAYAKEIKLGDLFCSTLSYTMTLNTFYQVIAIEGSKIFVVECDRRWVSGDAGYTGSVVAEPVTTWNPTKILQATICGENRISVEGKKATKTTAEETHYENHMD